MEKNAVNKKKKKKKEQNRTVNKESNKKNRFKFILNCIEERKHPSETKANMCLFAKKNDFYYFAN